MQTLIALVIVGVPVMLLLVCLGAMFQVAFNKGVRAQQVAEAEQRETARLQARLDRYTR